MTFFNILFWAVAIGVFVLPPILALVAVFWALAVRHPERRRTVRACGMGLLIAWPLYATFQLWLAPAYDHQGGSGGISGLAEPPSAASMRQWNFAVGDVVFCAGAALLLLALLSRRLGRAGSIVVGALGVLLLGWSWAPWTMALGMR